MGGTPVTGGGPKVPLQWPPCGDRPNIFYALPELHYPDRLNVVEVFTRTMEEQGWRDKVIYIEGTARVTYGEALERLRAWAQRLRASGVGAGDRVLLRMSDSVELVAAILGTLQVGAIAIPTFTQLRAHELTFRLEDAGVSAVIADEPNVDIVREAIGDRREIVLLSPQGSYLKDNADKGCEVQGTGRDDLALILYTSGTTGSPKGACHSHADLLAVCDSYGRYTLGANEADVLAGPPPIPFALGFGLFVLFPFRFGCTAVIDDDRTPSATVSRCAEHKVSILVAVPTYYNMLADDDRVQGGALAGVSRFLCGGEPLIPRVAEKWESLTGKPLRQFLGTTEMLHVFLAGRSAESVPTGSIGRPVPGYNVVLRDPSTFRPVRRGETGVLTVIGPTGTKYWQRPDKQREAVRQGWNVVSDIMREDEHGYFYFVSRADEVIMSGGMRISPAQVEEALMRHGAVAECACAAAPDPKGVRPAIVKAYIVLKDGVRPSVELVAEIQQFMKDTAPPYIYPRAIDFIDKLPRTASGKLMRRGLGEQQAAPPSV